MNQIIEQTLNFDPLRTPPLRDIALRHQRATRCGYLIETNDCCQCCGLEVNTQYISIKANIINLAFLGQGMPLFFNLAFLIILLIFILVLIFAQNCIDQQNTAYNIFLNEGCLQNCPLDSLDFILIRNLIQSEDCNVICEHFKDLCFNSIISSTSFLNKQVEENSKLIQTIFVFGIVLIIKIYLVIIRERQRIIEQTCDQELVSPSDFTAMFTGLPEQDYNEKELASAIEQYCQKFDSQLKYEVIKINIAYDIKLFVTKSLEKVRIEKILKNDEEFFLKKGRHSKRKYDIEKMNKILEQLKSELSNIESEIASGCYRKTTSVAFITFQTKQQLQNLILQTKLSYWEQFLSQIKKIIKNKDSNLFYFKDKLINICRAPEPDDIFWENCGVERIIKIKRKFISWIVTFILLGVSFGTLFGLEFVQNKYLSNDLDFIIKTSLSISKSVIITIVDALIYYFITLLANHERHITKTHQDSSVAQKLCYVQFINSCFLLIVIHVIGSQSSENYSKQSKFSLQKQGGIANDLLFVCGMNAFLASFTAFFNPSYFINKIKQKYIEQNHSLNQIEANKLFEGPQIILYDQYAYISKTTWMMLFLAPLIPFSILISFVGLFIYYWVQKYLLLRRYSKPPFQSSHLDKEMLSILDLSPILLSGMQYWLDDIYESSYLCKCINIGTLVLASLELIFPSYRIHHFFYKTKMNDIENQRYADVHLKFPTDYDRTNPLTQEQATQEFLKQKLELMSRTTISLSRFSRRKSALQALQDYTFRGIQNQKQQRIKQLQRKIQSAYKLKLFNQLPYNYNGQDFDQEENITQKQTDSLYQMTPNYNFQKIMNKFPNYSQFQTDLTSRSNSISSTIQLNTSKYRLNTKRTSQITSKRF